MKLSKFESHSPPPLWNRLLNCASRGIILLKIQVIVTYKFVIVVSADHNSKHSKKCLVLYLCFHVNKRPHEDNANLP